MLAIAEDLLILTLPDHTGRSRGTPMNLSFALAGAVLIELMIRGRLRNDEKKRLLVVDAAPTDDEILDEALARMTKAKRLKRAQDWVAAFSTGLHQLKPRLMKRLVARGVARMEHRHFMGLFPYDYYFTFDPAPYIRIQARLSETLLMGKPPEPQTSLLISLLYACQFISAHFPKGERKKARAKAAEIAKGDIIAKAVADLGAATAVIAATTAASS
jgi:golgi phosphoprotein 3